ncbi:PatA/PatG family cyanobactin maturation protease [Photobacterium sp. CCB-ST2H9]|uniref:PatA/PatG family cyanobactin maturation protease n=1 Tax=Photobacterium sp. CCB-ST2H9 TaxID=2912855 RepID=UPI0020C5E982|nr:PatA/PatG family cyanobactin maturation protease [Photobacterium sp. CCB-ST2H9]UTM59060.1 PatA/PatG family cyanobactin maturation protease [Photobacterium sp. CCB-ST2H9]
MVMESAVEQELVSVLEQLKTAGKHGAGINVAVIDGAIQHNHPMLTHLSIQQAGEVQQAQTKHGTAVCSLIAGQGVGLATDLNIISFPVFHEDNEGNISGCSERILAKAITQACHYQCDIINISGASLSLNGRGTDELRKAIKLCQDAGVLVVAAVGNEGQNTESIPASLDSVLAVGACDREGIPAIFNNHGQRLVKKMLLAPGVLMPVATPDNQITSVSGSSFATPIVSGICALLINALHLDRCASDTPERLRKILFETASFMYVNSPNRSGVVVHRINLSALLRHVVRKTNHSNLKPPPKRTNAMSNHEPSTHAVEPNPMQSAECRPQVADDISDLEPGLIDTLESSVQDEPEISSAELSSGNLSGYETCEPAALKLPRIADPAANRYVHGEPRPVRAQAIKDAREIQGAEKVFLIGTIGYDFGTEARLDYFTQVMGNKDSHPFDPECMAQHLNTGDNAEQSNALIWTLKIDGIPVYAIDPDSEFAVLQYARLVSFLHEQETAGVERVSIAGVVTGETRLFNGHVIPKVSPVLRGMFNWKSETLAELVMGETKDTAKTAEMTNFLNRIYYELRNRGLNSQERAINYAATNAYQMKEIFDDAFEENLFLNRISAEQSPVSRPESDCWDVILEFFNPKERLTAARKLYRYTVDVSDVIPVTIGTLRTWHAY